MESTRSELAYSTISEVSELIGTKRLSPVELTEAVINRIEQLNPKLNAYVTVTPELAMKQAREAECEIMSGRRKGPLHGIPIAHKDLYYTKGIRTTASSKVMESFVPDSNAATVSKLADAGTVLLGKLQTHEFAAGALTNSKRFGPCLNPWDPSRTPGGSSGGSGCAVAAGLTFMGTGSDTGGSIRIPAALCGVVGMKPTYGRVSRRGIFPLAWSLDHSGPLTRSVKDAAICLQAMSGYDPADPSTVDLPVPDYAAALRTDVKGMTIGIPSDYYFYELDPSVAQAVEEAAKELERLGAKLTSVSLPSIHHAPASLMAILYGEMGSIHEKSFKEHPEWYGEDLQNSLATAAFIPATAYLQAQRVRQLLREDFDSVLQTVDVLLAPTVPLPAPTIEPLGAGADRLASLTLPTDLTGHPTLSLPCGATQNGLPIGMQVIGRSFDESTVLSVGHVFEQHTIWHKMRPIA